MTLEGFYFIAQIIAALAIVGSLVFVGIQVRTQTREQVIHWMNERAGLSRNLNEWVVTDPDARRALAKAYHGLDDLNDEEFSIYMGMMRQSLLFLQLGFQQLPPGPVDYRSQSIFPILARLLGGKGFEQFWAHFRSDYPEPFCQRLDTLLAWAREEGGVIAYPGRECTHTAGGASNDA